MRFLSYYFYRFAFVVSTWSCLLSMCCKIVAQKKHHDNFHWWWGICTSKHLYGVTSILYSMCLSFLYVFQTVHTSVTTRYNAALQHSSLLFAFFKGENVNYTTDCVHGSYVMEFSAVVWWKRLRFSFLLSFYSCAWGMRSYLCVIMPIRSKHTAHMYYCQSFDKNWIDYM